MTETPTKRQGRLRKYLAAGVAAIVIAGSVSLAIGAEASTPSYDHEVTYNTNSCNNDTVDIVLEDGDYVATSKLTLTGGGTLINSSLNSTSDLKVSVSGNVRTLTLPADKYDGHYKVSWKCGFLHLSVGALQGQRQAQEPGVHQRRVGLERSSGRRK